MSRKRRNLSRSRGRRAKRRHLASSVVNNNSLMGQILSYLDVITLVKTKQVQKRWKELCTTAIHEKCKSPRPLESKEELHKAVDKYCQNDWLELEQLARIYGYPIGKWHVSQITDFSYLFVRSSFNKDIGKWDVSSATNMNGMFQECHFVQPRHLFLGYMQRSPHAWNILRCHCFQSRYFYMEYKQCQRHEQYV